MTIIQILQAVCDVMRPDDPVVGGLWSSLQAAGRGHLPDNQVQSTFDKIQAALTELDEHFFRLTRCPELSDDEWNRLKADQAAAVANGEIPF